jgi:hypothetical protein
VDVHVRGYRGHELQLRYSVDYSGPPRVRKVEIRVPFDAAFEVEVDDHEVPSGRSLGVIDQPLEVRVDL